jgi:CDP-4-dehydro-6-deoxyglucose reductase
MIERMVLDGDDRPVSLYWGGRDRADLYLLDHFIDLQRRTPNFRFIPVLAEPGEAWPGQRGFVQDAAAADFATLSDAVVYACGAPVMVDAARRLLTGQRSLPPGAFHADPFEPSDASGFPETPPASSVIRLYAVTEDGSLQTALDGRVGETLLEALKAAGLPVFSVCGGKKACGACRVRLDPPAPSWDRDEARLLTYLAALHPGDRLACQVRLHAGLDGLTVHLPASPV